MLTNLTDIVYIDTMEYKKIHLLYILIAVIFISCGSKQDNVQGVGPTRDNNRNTQANFDPSRITQEHYTSTMDEVRNFIEELNQVIRNRNYGAWRAALSDEYFAEISSQENLQHISALPAMRTRQIVLRTPEDYFIHVVVPSRANSRVDYIEFVSMSRVKAFTVHTNRAGEEQRLRLYDLEKIDNTWTIIN
jgi:hypothetical protein